MGITETQKIAQRDTTGVISTGMVYCLDTLTSETGRKEYMFSMLDGEFGKAISIQWYKRLPSKIKRLFN